MTAKPLYERSQELFLSWSKVPQEEIPDLLIELKARARPVTLFRESVALAAEAQVKHLNPKTMVLAPQDRDAQDSPAQTGEKILCVHHGKTGSLGFLSTIVRMEGRDIQINYPTELWIRRGRKHERFGLTLNMTAFWNNPTHGDPIFGHVMDVSYGGFLGGMSVAAYHDDGLSVQLHERGEIILLKSDLTRWRGKAELRRSALATQDGHDGDEVRVPVNGFSLLGFSFLFSNAEEASALGPFLEGAVEPL